MRCNSLLFTTNSSFQNPLQSVILMLNAFTLQFYHVSMICFIRNKFSCLNSVFFRCMDTNVPYVDSIEWFIEDQAFLQSYDSAPRPSPLPSASCLFFSVFLCVTGLATRERDKEPNRTNGRKPGPQLLFQHSLTHCVAVPDPHGYAFILVGWTRIRIENTDQDTDPGGPKWTAKVKKVQVLKC